MNLDLGGVRVIDEAKDASVLELVARDEDAAAELALAAVPSSALVAITTVKPVEWEDNVVALVGFPGEMARVGDANDVSEHGVAAITTGVAGTEGLPLASELMKVAPPFTLPLSLDGEFANTFVPGAPYQPREDLGGTSGGGYWTVLMTDEHLAVYVLATHWKSVVVGTERYAIGTPLTMHLRRLAAQSPELRAAVESQWPRALTAEIRSWWTSR